MAKEVTTFRTPEDLIERAEALIRRIASDPELNPDGGGSVSRSYVLRTALRLGLDVLEEKYSKKNG